MEIARVTVRYTYRVLRGEALVATGGTLLASLGVDLRPKRLPEKIAEVLASPERA